jgi:hypothetical protein
MFQEFESPAICYYFHEPHSRVYRGQMIGSNGVRAVVDFGAGFGTAFPLLGDLYVEELGALKELQRHLNRRMMANAAAIMALDGSMESSTVSVKFG